MRKIVRLACTQRIAGNALRVSLVVGTVLNVINQGGDLISGDKVSWGHALLNYLVPYCVSSYSAAKNELTKRDDCERTATKKV